MGFEFRSLKELTLEEIIGIGLVILGSATFGLSMYNLGVDSEKKRIRIEKPEPGIVHELVLGKDDIDKNGREERILEIRGVDHYVVETPNGYKVVPLEYKK